MIDCRPRSQSNSIWLESLFYSSQFSYPFEWFNKTRLKYKMIPSQAGNNQQFDQIHGYPHQSFGLLTTIQLVCNLTARYRTTSEIPVLCQRGKLRDQSSNKSATTTTKKKHIQLSYLLSNFDRQLSIAIHHLIVENQGNSPDWFSSRTVSRVASLGRHGKSWDHWKTHYYSWSIFD